MPERIRVNATALLARGFVTYLRLIDFSLGFFSHTTRIARSERSHGNGAERPVSLFTPFSIKLGSPALTPPGKRSGAKHRNLRSGPRPSISQQTRAPLARGGGGGGTESRAATGNWPWETAGSRSLISRLPGELSARWESDARQEPASGSRCRLSPTAKLAPRCWRYGACVPAFPNDNRDFSAPFLLLSLRSVKTQTSNKGRGEAEHNLWGNALNYQKRGKKQKGVTC